ncbi:MAG: rubredoxin-like domain-containing protein [Chloroflexota bacterium]
MTEKAKQADKTKVRGQLTRWECQVCGYIHIGPEPPEVCPVCGAPKSEFKQLE